jgi:cytochrome P450
VVTRAEHIKAIFHDSDRHFKAKNNDSGWMMSEVLGQCVGLLSGREWASLRSRVEVPFTHKSVLGFLPTIQARTQQYWADLFERKSAGAEAVRIHAAEDVKFLPFSLVAALIYGEGFAGDLERQLHDIVPTRERLFKHVIAGGITRFWWSSLLPTEANRLLRRFQKDWLAFNQEAYERARESGAGAPIVSLWEQAQRGEINRTQASRSAPNTSSAY